MFEKTIVIDARGHLLGRLASTIAKELLNGQDIFVVRCEEINISGSLFRNRIKYMGFLRKRTNTNPKKGPFHFRAPSKMLWRTIRGMVPHKTERGQIAMGRLEVYEGIPHPYDRVKRMVVPQCLRNLRLKPGRKFCRLGDLASTVGWKHDDLIQRLEKKRKTKSAAFYARKKAQNRLRQKAVSSNDKEVQALGKKLARYGHTL